MASISVISFSPYERYHLLLCELDDTMFVVDCGWPAEGISDTEETEEGKSRAERAESTGDPRDVVSTINWGRVDFILVSNHEQMTLLPYITEYTEFSGAVYATEPAKAYGRCVMEAGVEFAERGSAAQASNSRQYSQVEAAGAGSSSSRHAQAGTAGRGRRTGLYSQQDIVAAMEKITDVRHGEMVSPVPFVQAYSRSSGYSIGAANWTVEYKGHRTAFVSTSSFAACLHPQEWDGRVISEAHVIVICDASDPAGDGEAGDGSVPASVQVSQRINQLCSTAMATLRQRGRVLLIGEPYGVTQDILQLVAENVASLNLPLPQVIVVSPVGERTLQYGNIMGEWLCEAKQALLYLPEYPFSDKDLRQKGHLHFVRALSDLATLQVPQGSWFVVVSPQDVPAIDHFIRLWERDARNCSGSDAATASGAARFSVLLHSDDVAWAQALVRRLSVGPELTYVPVSCRLTLHSIEQCLAGAECAQQVLVPSPIFARLAPADAAGSCGIPRSLAASGLDFRLFEYSYLQAATVHLDTDRHLPLSIQKEMALQLRASGKQHALVSGTLSFAAGKIRLARDDLLPTNAQDQDQDQNQDQDQDQNQLVEKRGPAALVDTSDGAPNVIGAAAADLALWTPHRLATELNDIGVNAAVVDGVGVRIVMPGGSATVHMHRGWAIDCTSPASQWTVMDSLRQVLNLAHP